MASRRRRRRSRTNSPCAATTSTAYGWLASIRSSATPPEREPAPPATVERRQQREEREQAREEEQAVHPPVDPVEHQHPASRGEGSRDDARQPVCEPRTQKCDQRNARHREHKRDDAEPRQPAAEVHDQPRETEVERGSAAFCDDRVQHVAERAAADEERERLVLVGRPGAQKPAEDPGQRRRHRGRRRPEGVHFPETQWAFSLRGPGR